MGVIPIIRLHGWTACFIVVVIFALNPIAKCRDYIGKGFEYWFTTGADFDIEKNWRVSVNEQLRLSKDARKFSYQYTDLGFIYEGFSDWLDLGFYYRQIFNKSGGENWLKENRPHVDLTVKSKLKDLDLSDRSRIEYRDKEEDRDTWRYANKLIIKLPYEFTKWKLRPNFADQVFIDLSGTGFDRNKIYSGFSFKPSRGTSGGLYYIWDSDKTDGKWTNTNILWLQLKFYF